MNMLMVMGVVVVDDIEKLSDMEEMDVVENISIKILLFFNLRNIMKIQNKAFTIIELIVAIIIITIL